MSCTPGSYEVTLAACPDEIILKAGLTEAPQYVVEVENRFNGRIRTLRNIDLLGNITLDIFHLFPGSFNPHSGAYRLTVYDLWNNQVPLRFKGKTYDSVLITFADINVLDGNPVNVIE